MHTVRNSIQIQTKIYTIEINLGVGNLRIIMLVGVVVVVVVGVILIRIYCMGRMGMVMMLGLWRRRLVRSWRGSWSFCISRMDRMCLTIGGIEIGRVLGIGWLGNQRLLPTVANLLTKHQNSNPTIS